jgi:hypothetical protein
MGCSNAATGMQNGTCAPRLSSATRACPTTNPTACVNLQSDANNCNSCGNVCQSGGAPAGSARACLYGQCGFACTASGMAIATGQDGSRSCVRTTWNFENPNPGLAGVDGWTNSNETRIELVNTRHSGNQGVALYASFLEMYPAYTDHYFRDSAGNISTLDLRGKTYSAWVMVGAATPISTDFCRLQAQTNLAPYDIFFGPSATRTQPPANTWFELTGTFGTTAAEAVVSGLWVMCKLPTSWTEDDARRWYVDDISVY